MSATKKPPKWAPLLLTLLIGVLTTLGVQFFISGAVPLPAYIAGAVPLPSSSSRGKSCLIENGTANSSNKGLAIRVGQGLSGTSLSTDLFVDKNGSSKSKVAYHCK